MQKSDEIGKIGEMLTLVLTWFSIGVFSALADSSPLPEPQSGYPPAPPPLSALGVYGPSGTIATPDASASDTNSKDLPPPVNPEPNPTMDFNANTPMAKPNTNTPKPQVGVGAAGMNGAGMGMVKGMINY